MGGESAEPRPASTVILVRGGGQHSERGLEVLLVLRNPNARFMPGVWVFPGGAVDDVDGAGDDGARAAAVREVHEEVGIELESAAIVPYSRWITPKVGRIRFDTHFFLALSPPHSRPEPDGEETVDAAWLAPRTALDRHYAGELPLVFPTIKHLETLTAYATAAEAFAAAADRDLAPILPEVVEDGDGQKKIVLPDGWGEPTPLPPELR